MRERLIALLDEADKQFSCDIEDYRGFISKMADYLLAEGVIVLPCKVGDNLFILNVREHKILTFTVVDFLVRKDKVIVCGDDGIIHGYYGKYYCELCEISDFGKTVFLTKEEAEKALAKRRK